MNIKLVAALILELMLDQYSSAAKFQEIVEAAMANYDDALAAYDIDDFYSQVTGRLDELTTLLYQKVQLEQQIQDIIAQIGSI